MDEFANITNDQLNQMIARLERSIDESKAATRRRIAKRGGSDSRGRAAKAKRPQEAWGGYSVLDLGAMPINYQFRLGNGFVDGGLNKIAFVTAQHVARYCLDLSFVFPGPAGFNHDDQVIFLEPIR